MSKLEDRLMIVPPVFMRPGGNNGEVFTSYGHTCSYCNGSGYFTERVTHGITESKNCPICKGKGKLTAKVVVGWVPAE